MDVDAVIAREARARARRRARPHEPSRGAQPQALRGHRRDPRGGDRRHLDGQHPAPREPQRRRLRADRGSRPRDLPRPDPRRGRRGRARRPDARGAPGAAPRRQGLPADRVEAALENFFRLDNLAALRELVLRELAEDVEARRHDRGARPAQPAGGRRADPRARHAGAALAAHPPPRLPLRAAARLRDRRRSGCGGPGSS